MPNQLVHISSKKIVRDLVTKKASYWISLSKKRSLALFHLASKKVPAYKDFLKKNKISPTKIKTWADFQNVPQVNKNNYLRKYPTEKMCWGGNLDNQLVFTASSGSTGEPVYFPRTEQLDEQYSTYIETFLRNSSYSKKKPILVIIGFGMGIWIGGLITYKAFEIVARRNNIPLSIITPGINKDEINKALKTLAPKYKQVILVGYPPFIKDVVDGAIKEKINLKQINLRFFFAAEAFSEKFRDYLNKKAGIKNIYKDTFNIYGSADIGAMGYETGISIIAKRNVIQNKRAKEAFLSSTEKVPTFAQFNPYFINFESVDGDVLLTGHSELPLIRYAIGDSGKVLDFNDAVDTMLDCGINLKKEAKRVSLKPSEIHELPFLLIYERNDFSTKLYGAIIYPEHIREVFQMTKYEKFFTGRFTLITKTDNKHNQFIEVNCEKKKNLKIPNKIRADLQNSLINNLRLKNAEFQNNYSSMPKQNTPKLVFWEYGHPKYFKPGIKQKWVIK